jgi:hypothetical protein
MNIFQPERYGEFEDYFIIAENEQDALNKLKLHLETIYSDVDKFFHEYKMFQLKESSDGLVYSYYE